MEELKKFEEICEPDERQKHFATINESRDEIRPLTLRDLYDAADSIKLHDGVPDAICSHFETARNLLVYSWFYYPFNVVAQLQAFASAEYALRIRANVNPVTTKRPPGFKLLLKQAADEGWITDAGFSRALDWKLQGMGNILTATTQRSINTYCEALAETLPYLRNRLAHGENMLHNQGADFLLICSELINQLFQPTQTQSA
jgi:hypothetical protein